MKKENPDLDKKIKKMLKWGDHERAEQLLKEAGPDYNNYSTYYSIIRNYKAQKERDYRRQKNIENLIS